MGFYLIDWLSPGAKFSNLSAPFHFSRLTFTFLSRLRQHWRIFFFSRSHSLHWSLLVAHCDANLLQGKTLDGFCNARLFWFFTKTPGQELFWNEQVEHSIVHWVDSEISCWTQNLKFRFADLICNPQCVASCQAKKNITWTCRSILGLNKTCWSDFCDLIWSLFLL